MPTGTKKRAIKGSARHRDSAETRAAILRAAERIYAESGLAGARTEAIAAAAGVNKALLYYYFKSKQALYQAVVGTHVKEFHEQASQVLSAKGAAGPILMRYVSNHFDFIGTHPYYPRIFQRMMMAGDRTLESVVREHSLPISRMLVALVERGIRSGEFRSFDRQHTVLSIAGLTASYFNMAPALRLITGQDPFSKANLAKRKSEALKFIRYALFTNPEVRER